MPTAITRCFNYSQQYGRIHAHTLRRFFTVGWQAAVSGRITSVLMSAQDSRVMWVELPFSLQQSQKGKYCHTRRWLLKQKAVWRNCTSGPFGQLLLLTPTTPKTFLRNDLHNLWLPFPLLGSGWAGNRLQQSRSCNGQSTYCSLTFEPFQHHG